MPFRKLRILVDKIHSDPEIMSRAAGKKIDVETTSARELRNRIVQFLSSFSETTVDAGPIKSADADEIPDFLFDGARVEVDLEGEWVPGAVRDLEADKKVVIVDLDDGTTCEAPFATVRQMSRRAKPR